KMRRVNQDQLIVTRGKINLFFEYRNLVSRVLVQPDLANPQHGRPIQHRWDQLDHLARKLDILSLLRVDAQPAVVLNAIPSRPLWLDFGEQSEVVIKTRR